MACEAGSHGYTLAGKVRMFLFSKGRWSLISTRTYKVKNYQNIANVVKNMISLLNLNSAPGLLLYHIQEPWQIITRPLFHTWDNLTLACEDVGNLAYFCFFSLFVCPSFFNSSLAPLFSSGYENEA